LFCFFWPTDWQVVATGGSLVAAASLVRRLGGEVVLCFCPLAVAPLLSAATARLAAERLSLATL
jgi:adenine/guanine phosphoribosyltransferase-like PRPP-binding protein